MARERKFSTEQLYQHMERLLLQHGYEGFTFSLLAETMNISRGAIYKYYENKDEMMYDYMVYVMEQFMSELHEIEDENTDFPTTFDRTVDLFFKYSKVHQIVAMSHSIHNDQSETIQADKQRLDLQHESMYECLERMINQGKKDGFIKSHIHARVIFGLLFRIINVPNHLGFDHAQWKTSMKEILKHGIYS